MYHKNYSYQISSGFGQYRSTCTDSVTAGFIEFINANDNITVHGAKQVMLYIQKQYDITMIYAGGDLTQTVWTHANVLDPRRLISAFAVRFLQSKHLILLHANFHFS